MSLKTFHVFFISCSVLMSFGLGYWGFWGTHSGGFWPTAAGVLGFGAGAGLIVYEIRFLRKLRGVSYL